MFQRKTIITMLVPVVFAFGAWAQNSPLRASPPIGAVVQTWHYDAKANTAIITLVNTTQKDILACDLSITETFADGSSDSHEVMIDLLDRMFNAHLATGTV